MGMYIKFVGQRHPKPTNPPCKPASRISQFTNYRFVFCSKSKIGQSISVLGALACCRTAGQKGVNIALSSEKGVSQRQGPCRKIDLIESDLFVVAAPFQLARLPTGASRSC